VGYTTQFSGQVTIEPPLSGEQVLFLKHFAGQDHRKSGYKNVPGYFCQWEPDAEGTVLEWDGGEKFYDAVEWMRYLIREFIAGGRHEYFTTPRTVNGTILAQGEEVGDVWRIVVIDNVVITQTPKFD
jgi:hypothetical protein